jgi:hypothetical protein
MDYSFRASLLPAAGIIILAATILVAFAGAEADAEQGTVGDGLSWSFENGTLTVSGEGPMETPGVTFSAPWESLKPSIRSVVISDGVTTIGAKAFYGCSALKTADLGEVTKIGTKTFAKSGLESVDMGSSLKTIGQYAFYQTGLKVIKIPYGTKTIGASAFSGLSPSKIDIPVTVKTIGDNAFYKMKFLDMDGRTVLSAVPDDLKGRVFDRVGSSYISRIPVGFEFEVRDLQYSVVSVEPLEAEVVGGSASLTSLTVPLTTRYETDVFSVVSIGDKAFYQRANLESVNLGTIVKIGSKAFASSGVKTVNLGISLETIGQYAFYKCPLTSLVIPDGVKSIGASAFSGCTSISDLTVPDSVESMGTNAFNGLKFVGTDGKSISYLSDKFLGHRYTGSKTLTMVKDVKVGDKFESDGLRYQVTSLEPYHMEASLLGFVSGFSADDLKIDESVMFERHKFAVTSIASKAFMGNASIESVYIPGSVASIGMKAFANCPSLSQVKICDGSDSIGSYAFYGCKNVESMKLPSTLTSIGSQALNGFSFYDLNGSKFSATASVLAGKAFSGSGSSLHELMEASFLFCDNFENDGFVSYGQYETNPDIIIPGIWVHGYGTDFEGALVDACGSLGMDVEFGDDGRISEIGNVVDGNVFIQQWEGDWTYLNGDEYLGIYDIDLSGFPEGERFFAIVHGGASAGGEAPEPNMDPDEITWYFEDCIQRDRDGVEVLFYIGDNFLYSEMDSDISDTDPLTLLVEGVWMKGYAEPGKRAQFAFVEACDAIGYTQKIVITDQLECWIAEINGVVDGNLLQASWDPDVESWTQDYWLGNTEAHEGLTMCVIHGGWGGGADDPPYPEATPRSMIWAY